MGALDDKNRSMQTPQSIYRGKPDSCPCNLGKTGKLCRKHVLGFFDVAFDIRKLYKYSNECQWALETLQRVEPGKDFEKDFEKLWQHLEPDEKGRVTKYKIDVIFQRVPVSPLP